MHPHCHKTRSMAFGLLFVVLLLGWSGLGFAGELIITPAMGLQQLATMAKQSQLQPGTTVTLRAGTYTGMVSLSYVNGTAAAPIVIQAEAGAVIESWANKSTKAYGNGSSILMEKCSYIEFRNLDISGATRGMTLGSSHHIKVTKSSIHDISNYGIMNYRTSDVLIDGNVIERSSVEHGIYISGSATGVKVTNNTVRDTHVNGIHVNGVVVAPVVENNILERTGRYPTAAGGAGITFIGGVTSPTVRNNTFRNVHGQGITIDATDGLIAFNTFEGNSWSSILTMANATNLKLDSNKFQDLNVIPLQFSTKILSNLVATNNTYSIKTGIVCNNTNTNKRITLTEWKAMGFDGVAPTGGTSVGSKTVSSGVAMLLLAP